MAILTVARVAHTEPMPGPLDALGTDTARAFGGWNSIYYGAAIAGTAALAPSGADHAARTWVQERVHAPLWGQSAYYAGYLLPVLVAPGIFLAGLAGHDAGLAGAGAAAVQALGLTVITTAVLKVGTGRPFPMHGGDPNAPDRLDHPEYAREFVPFGLAGRYAWPSGHTSASISIAAALTATARGSVVVPAIAYPVALGIGAGMIVGDHHWVSDVLAGALIGQAIGWSVGESFRERAHGARGEAARLHLVPLLGAGLGGCAVVGEL